MKYGYPDQFDLDKADGYARWRAWRLHAYPARFSDLRVDVEEPERLSINETLQLQQRLDRYNMVIYRSEDRSENPCIPLAMGRQFGLHRLDHNLAANQQGISEIQVREGGVHGRYIPYTANKLSWHADGYYHTSERQIRGMSLHCVRPSVKGGENLLLDPEMAYLYLRDLDPAYVRALSQPDVMTIPENRDAGKLLRPAQSGPVFSIDAQGYLHMRYSARQRNIEWKGGPELADALEALQILFESDSGWIFRGRLQSGEGLICNNVLHNRTAFEEDPESPRLLYRLRYLDRVPTIS